MPEQLKPTALQQSHAQALREDAARWLSRSPHPYHRQRFELPYGSEKFNETNANISPAQSPVRSTQTTNDEDPQEWKPVSRGCREREFTNSDSGTEADDEHFLKGLPAPRLRPHKGLRGADGDPLESPSLLLSPALLEGNYLKPDGFLLPKIAPSADDPADESVRAVERFRRKRSTEVVRRSAEAAILCFVGGLLCVDPQIRRVVYQWRKELACQFVITFLLLAAYPLRLLRHIQTSNPWKQPLPIAIPGAFDPAALLYPPTITILVSLLLSRNNPADFLVSISLGIASLPRRLIPSTGGLEGSNIIHWALTCLPMLVSNAISQARRPTMTSNEGSAILNPEILVLLRPLHQALCHTLYYLTTTSLLPAELQLLSISLIGLLLLARSPQTTILQVLLWGGGVGVLIACGRVLVWGVVLARVPKWRFKRAEIPTAFHGRKPNFVKKVLTLGKTATSLFGRDVIVTDSSEEEETDDLPRTRLKPNSRDLMPSYDGHTPNGSVSIIDSKTQFNLMNGATKLSGGDSIMIKRRHTLPALSSLPPRSSKRTPSGRRKRATSSSIQAFFHLTQKQATIRKWLYAGYVYVCVAAIILVGIREYVQRFALNGNEPIGWALGYLFGDLPWFRIQVVSYNLQRWVCLPPRSGREREESCYMGWVEHLRHTSFGPANTRLILCAYWLAIIIVGLSIVFRLSSIYEVDTRRKVFHFMMVAMLLPATYVDPTFAALALSLMLAIFLLLDLFRASQLPPLSKFLAHFLAPYVDGRDLKGPVVISHIFLLIGCAIPLWLSLGSLPRTGTDYLAGWEVPMREVSMVSGVICVGMGDAAASLIGRRYGRRKWLWGGGKSIEGSVAFATAVGLALVLAKAWLRIGGWPANNDDAWVMTFWKAGVAAWVASLTEAVLTGGNDNVVVPVVLWLCVKGLDI
ncbi:cytidylyltransferase [Diplocarpon rosae]|nr:cytidylyltransferase [Diplocarpon rosae]